MATPSDEQVQIANALNNLAAAMERFQHRYDAAQAANRRVRVAMFVATVLILGGIGYLMTTPVAKLLPLIPPPKLAIVDPEAAEVKRIQLLASLPAEERAIIEDYERQIRWVSNYLDVFPEFQAGAAITLFLAQMSTSVEVMPAIYAEVHAMTQEMQAINDEIRGMNEKMDALPILANDVQGMNGRMQALPVLATEVQGIHRQVAVMSAGLDSTMGRAGRMMPWNW